MHWDNLEKNDCGNSDGMSCLYVCCDILVRNGEKDKKKIEKEREKREAYFSTMASLFILSSLPSKSFWFFFCLCFLLWNLKDYMIYTLSAVIIFASSIVHHHSLDLKAIGHQTVYKFPKIRVVLLLSCCHVCKTQRQRVQQYARLHTLWLCICYTLQEASEL